MTPEELERRAKIKAEAVQIVAEIAARVRSSISPEELERRAKIKAEAVRIVAEIKAQVRASKELECQLNNPLIEVVETSPSKVANIVDRGSSDSIVPKVYLDSFQECRALAGLSI